VAYVASRGKFGNVQKILVASLKNKRLFGKCESEKIILKCFPENIAQACEASGKAPNVMNHPDNIRRRILRSLNNMTYSRISCTT
jgi:hypothetical protein